MAKMKVLNVPHESISEHKKSPMRTFEKARDEGSGVYIFNKSEVAGVVITQEQYEEMVNQVQDYEKEIERLKGLIQTEAEEQ